MSEGALAAELGNLIHSHLPDKLYLRYEYAYSSLIPKKAFDDDITPQARVDLAISEYYRDDAGMRRSKIQYIVELKRASASNTRINRDLRRLAGVIENTKGVRAFLCVASEESRPPQFTNEGGYALKSEFKIEGTESVFVVTNVMKAAFLFKDRERAHYVCLIEVVPPDEPEPYED